MSFPIHFTGRIRYRLHGAAELCGSIADVSVHRMLRGPRRPTWNWFVELSTDMLRRHLFTAFKMPEVKDARAYLDSVVVRSPACSQVTVTNMVHEKFSGSWIVSKRAEPRVSVLYFHGGGYSFYPRSYAHLIALITLATGAKIFALDYRLAPEHRFPAQLEDALSAYRWLLETGTDPQDLVLIGDSAGGNLALTLLLAARESQIALPALAIALSPATDFQSDYPSIVANRAFDWINKEMLTGWADWFCESAQRKDALVSPLWADLRGLPPIYIQAGRCEILYDSIQAFANRGMSQGADVVLESWDDMNHDFQMFGTQATQSIDALRRIGEVISMRVRKRDKNVSLFNY